MYKLTLYICTQSKYLEYSLKYPSVWKMWSTGLPNLKFWIFGLMYYNCSGKLIIMPTRILEKVILTYDFRRFRNSLTYSGALRRGVTLVDPSDPWDFLPRSPNRVWQKFWFGCLDRRLNFIIQTLLVWDRSEIHWYRSIVLNQAHFNRTKNIFKLLN